MQQAEYTAKDLIYSTIKLFEHITDSLEIKIDKEKIRTIVRNPSHLLPEAITIEEHLDFIESIAKELDIRLITVRSKSMTIIDTASIKSPIYTLDKNNNWLAVTSIKSNKITIYNFSQDKQFEMNKEQFLEHLGKKPTDKILWLAPEPMYPFTKKKQAQHHSIFQQLLSFLKPEMKDIWIIVAYSFGIGVFSLVVPVAISSLISTVAFGTLLQPVVVLTSVVLFFLTIAGGMSILQSYVVEYLQRRLFIRIINELTHKLLNIDRAKFRHEYLPEFVSRYFEIFTLQKNMTVLLMDGLALILITFVGLLIISVYHPFFLLYSVFLLLMMYFFIFIKISEGSDLAIKVSKHKFKLYHWLIDITENINLFRNKKTAAMGMEKIDFLSRDYLYTRDKNFMLKVKQHIGGIVVQGVGHAILLGLGGYLVINRHLTLGQLVAAELIISKVLDSFSGINKYLDTYYALVAAIDKVTHLVEIPTLEKKTETIHLNYLPKKIELKNIKISDSHTNYSNINFTFEAGKVYTLYSHSPDMVSNLLDMISGEFTSDSGTVLLDGQDIKFLETDSLSESVMLIRDIEIFQGTIIDNIRTGRYDVTLGDIYSALSQTGLLEDVAKLKESIANEITSLGYPLRPHQLRLLMVSRAFCHSGGILVLDNILDEIDTTNLSSIISAIKERCSSKNTILIHTERKEVIEQFDNLVILSQDGLIKTTITELL